MARVLPDFRSCHVLVGIASGKLIGNTCFADALVSRVRVCFINGSASDLKFVRRVRGTPIKRNADRVSVIHDAAKESPRSVYKRLHARDDNDIPAL